MLRAAGIGSDGASLVQWFHAFAPPAADPASARALIARPGADEFTEREAAVDQLIAMGARAAPYLQQAVRDRDRELAIRAEHCLRVIDAGPGPEVHAAALRVLAQSKPRGGAAALLDYLPY